MPLWIIIPGLIVMHTVELVEDYMLEDTLLFHIYPILTPVLAAEAPVARVETPIAAASAVATQRLKIFFIFIAFSFFIKI